jgi:hypothetical protein
VRPLAARRRGVSLGWRIVAAREASVFAISSEDTVELLVDELAILRDLAIWHEANEYNHGAQTGYHLHP